MNGYAPRRDFPSSEPILRRLDDAAVVFDSGTWQTHLLPPVAAVIADIIGESTVDGRTDFELVRHALRDELELDPDAPEIVELLRMLAEIGILRR